MGDAIRKTSASMRRVLDRQALRAAIQRNLARLRLEQWVMFVRDYGTQIMAALVVHGNSEGGEVDDSFSTPTFLDVACHYIALPWKLAFAIMVPPATWCGALPAFICSLLMVGW